MKLSEDMRRMMRDSVRTYFAPVTGAIKGIRAELHRVERDAKRRRDRQVRREQQATRVA